MKQLAQKQRGLTLISLVLVLALIGFFTLLVLKIGPIYLNHSKVTNALAALEQTTDVETKSKYEIETILDKRFNLNYVEHVDKDDIKISKHGNYLKVEIEYERIEPIMGNLSVLVDFYEKIEVGNE
ncbi:DUF4845 domain-containing protein [Methylomarinum sp. Ch1-1]|uniref:DUF4845 domain-containing protein n=1 Tax=Methylomarinum roseum TaxID=3067653 RepID=A0AAU7NSJ3_9GAMM|nr:DUF4845 domain-containing protein [Methylomarinum sp. Ch1-1]MDP4520057.1 DUF4845 domain-containing protein [Methylomarinum sp. Ch1-1]